MQSQYFCFNFGIHIETTDSGNYFLNIFQLRRGSGVLLGSCREEADSSCPFSDQMLLLKHVWNANTKFSLFSQSCLSGDSHMGYAHCFQNIQDILCVYIW